MLFVGCGGSSPTAGHYCLLHCLRENCRSLPLADIEREGPQHDGPLLLRNWTQFSAEYPALLEVI